MKLFFTLLFSLIFLNAKAQMSYEVFLNFDNDTFRYTSEAFWHPHDTEWICCVANLITLDTTNYKHNTWQIGRPNKTVFTAAHSKPNAIITDTIHSCIPNDTSVFILKVPTAYYLQEFIFWYKLDIDTGDIATMEVSSDTGLHWVNALDTNTSQYLYSTEKPDLSKSNKEWDSILIVPPIGSWFERPDTFLFRFTFISGPSVKPRDGWMLDDFMFNYVTDKVSLLNKTINCNLYPNPAKDNLHLKYSLTTQADLELTLTNVLGQTLKTKYIPHTLSGTADISVSDLPNGLYFYSISSGKGKTTGKIVIEH